MRANLGAAIVAASLLLANAAQAQSVWGGPSSTTTTQNYKLGTNWDPNGAPVAAGQSAIFDTTGKSTINVNGGAIAPDSWTFNANAQSYAISGPAVNFSATGGLFNNANAGQTISIDNNLKESAAGAQLQQLGNSTLILTGNNTYSGGTVIAAGTLQIGNGGTTGKINGDVLDLGVLAFNRSNNITFDGQIIGSGKVNQIGTGTLILGGANTYSGGTLIANGGTLRANNSTPGTSSSVGTGTVTLDNGQFQAGAANLTFSNNFTIDNSFSLGSAFDNNGKTLTLSGIIADGTDINGRFGSVTFVNTGPGGRTILTGANTYTGGTTICNCATLQLGAASSSGSIVGRITNEGELRVVNSDTTGITTIVNTGVTEFFNTTSASTATIRNIGGGVQFVNHSTAGNATIVNRAGGLIAFANNSTAGDATITTRQFAQTFFEDHSNGGNARFITNGTGLVDFSGTTGAGGLHQITAGSIEGSGGYFIGNGNTLAVGSNNRSTEVSGVIADNCGCSPGPGALQKVGTGTLMLSGANTYSGGTTFTGGTLSIAADANLGASAGALTFNGGILQFTNSLALTLSNTRAITLQSGGGEFKVTNGNVIVNQAIGGSGAFTKSGAGVLILNGNNTYGGVTTINAGTLALSGAGSIAGSSGVVDNATFDISATTAGASIKNLSGAGIVTLGSQTLTLSNAAGLFAGVIGGTGGLIKQGAGLFELSGANTYAGPTTVAGGNLRVNGSVTGAVNVQTGATLSGTGSVGGLVTVQAGGTLSAGQSPGTLTLGALNLNAGSTSVFELGSPGVVGGPTNDLVNVTGNLTLGGTLSVNAPSAGYYRLFNYGTLTPSNFATVTGSSNGTATVLTNVSNQVNLLIAGAGQRIQFWDGADQTGNGVVNGGAGTWNAANTNWTGAPGQAAINDQWRSSVGVFAGSAGTVTVAGAQAFDTLQFSTTGYVLNAGAGGQLQLAGLSGTGTINTDNAVLATINTPIVNGSAQSLTKVGGGTLILAAANTYSGGTTISGGTLQLGNGGTAGSIIGNVTNNGVLAINRSDGLTLAGAISGSGAVNQLGTGTTTLIATNDYSGGTTISGGTLQLGNGGTTGSIVGNVLNNSVLAVNRSNAFTFAGVISGSGVFNQIGGGTTTLGGVNTYTGATTIGAGGLTIAGGASITSNVTSNAAFNNFGIVAGNLANAGTAGNDRTITGAVTNSGTFNNNTAGTVGGGLTNTAGTTTNAGTVNGGVNVSAGTLNTMGTINGGLTNSSIVNASGAINGAVANNTNGIFKVAAGLTTDGTFDNAAGATLAIASTGAAFVQGLLTNSGAVTVANMGQFTAAGGITNKAGGTITIANGGSLHDDLNNAGSVTNNGFYSANVASNTGSITNNAFWTGNLVSNSGLVANNGAWVGTVSNAGMFDNSGFVGGLFTNTAGVAVNNGFLTAGARVTGGMLTGAGFVIGDLTLAGGTFVPGNGTPGSFMTVSGNLAFQSGALYLVQLNPARSTFTRVNGTAALNGSAGAAFLAGNYVAKQYTILTAAGGVNGTFGSFDTAGIPNGFNASLSYDANNVFLDLNLNFAVPGGLNANQQNVANALTNFFNATGGIPAVFGTLTPGGLAQASGELATRTQQTSFEAMNLFLGLLTDPFVAGRGDGAPPAAGASQFAEQNVASAYASSGNPRTKSEREAYAAIYRKASIRDTYDPRWSVWAAGYGGSQTTDGNAALGSNNTRSSIGGVAVGADYRFSPNTLAGFAIAGGGTGFSVANSGSGRSDLFQAGAFVRHTNGHAYISAALAYGWQDVTTDRIVTIAGSDLLRANFNANTFSGRAEGGYRFVAPWIGGVGITPYAAGQFTTIDLPAYAEQAIAGANAFALTYVSKSVTDTRSELGVRTDRSFAMQNGIFTLRGRAAWAHDFNPDRNIAATFQTLPGASFVVNGAAQASDAALVTGSAEMKWLNGFSLAATFEGEFSGVTRAYAGKGVARYAW